MGELEGVVRALLYMADVWSVAGLLNEMHARVCAALVIDLFLTGSSRSLRSSTRYSFHCTAVILSLRH